VKHGTGRFGGDVRGQSAVEFALVLPVFLLILIALIVYTPWGNVVFGTAPLAAEVWLFALPFAAAMLVLEEGRKAFMRRRAAARGQGRAAHDAGPS